VAAMVVKPLKLC